MSGLLPLALGSALAAPVSLGGAVTAASVGLVPLAAEVHPGAQAEAELGPAGGRGHLRWAATLGYDWFPGLAHGAALGVAAVGRWPVGRRLELEAGGGPGYHHTWFPGPTYTVDDAGRWRTVADPGRPHALVTARLGLGVPLRVGVRAAAAFVRWEPQLEAPWVFGLPAQLHGRAVVALRVGPRQAP